MNFQEIPFQHFLVTKINLGYFEKGNKLGLPPNEWLEYRIDLFLKTCFQSVCNQTNKNFEWLIYLDDRTPDSVKNLLTKTQEKLHNIHLFYRKSSFEGVEKLFKSDYREFLSPGIKYIITTRLDSDDMIHKDFVAKLQSLFRYQDYQAINFNNGGTFLMKNGVFGVAIHRTNPFISLIEKIQENQIKSVFYKKHMEYLYDKGKMEVWTTSPMWCMTVHKLNISTGFFGRALIFDSIDMLNFFGYTNDKKSSFLLRAKLNFNFIQRKSRKIIPFIKRKLRL